MPRITNIQARKGTATDWLTQNPVLASGELGYDLTNKIFKIGDGSSNWTTLSTINLSSSNITDFNSAISGVLPVKSLSAGDNITISSVSGVYTINSTGGGSSSSNVGVRGVISTTGNLTSFSVSGGYPVGYLDLFQDGVKLVSDADFTATDGSNVTLTNSVPSGTVLEYLTIASGVTSSGGSTYDSRWDLFLPPAPTGVSVSAGNAQATVSWTAPTVLSQTPITDYLVQYSSNSGVSWNLFDNGISTTTNTAVTGLINNTAYQFKVAAVNGIGTGNYSAATSSVTPIAGDQYFNKVKFLLHADGSDSVFTDSSAYGRIITTNGGVTQSSSQSRWGGKSLFIDSVSKYLSVDSSDFSLTGDFVMECWVYMTGSASSYVLIEARNNTNAYEDFVWYLHNGGYIGFVVGPSYARLDGNSALVPQNQWTHIALVRSGGIMSAYVNGVRDAVTINYSGAITPVSSTLRIGSNGSNSFSGYIDDLRITVDSSRGYTGATIIVPPAVFPDIDISGLVPDPYYSSVSLLLHADGTGSTFVDSSPTPKTITAYGDATQSATQSKWGGKSAAFDGSGDYLTIPAIAFGTGDFVLECWLYFNSISGSYTGIYDGRPGVNGAYPALLLNGSNIAWYVGNAFEITGSSLSAGQWYHVAVARASGSTRMYLNGTQVGTTFSDSTNYASSATTFIGNGSGGFFMNGFIDDLRITVGSSRGMTGSTITVPTAAFPDSGFYQDPILDKVSLLLHADGSGSTFVDSSLKPKTITATGATQSATQSKWGGKSADLTTGGYLNVSSDNGFGFGTEDFVQEFWLYYTGGYGYVFFTNNYTGSGAYIGYGLQSGTKRQFIWYDGTVLMGDTDITNGTWQHHAVVRSNGVVSTYLNGIRTGTASFSNDLGSSRPLAIGHNSAGGQLTYGYIDDLRVTKGSNRNYTGSTIIVPTGPFPDS